MVRAKATSARQKSKRKPTKPKTGWELDASELGDFYHVRIRKFPPAATAWRKRMVERVRADHKLFPAIPREATDAQVRELIDQGISHLREVARILALLHGTPNLGNKKNPVDELVYIILSRKTYEEAYQKTFDDLKKAFPTWDALLRASRKRVEKIVGSGGLGGKKTESLYRALGALREKFGKCTLDPVHKWTDEEVEKFLCSLPEISRKSAYCVMMYSLGRKVLPADTHVGRMFARLGIYRELGLDLSGHDHKKLQVVLADLIPPELRYSFHVNMVTHGRDICRKQKPRCDECELRKFCSHNRATTVDALAEERPTVLDLFCGAGGMSEGFSRAGFRSVLAIEKDPAAARSFWLNHPEIPDDRILIRDICEVTPREVRGLIGRRRPDALIGSPPCQGFSSAGFRSKKTSTGYRVEKDERNFLFEYMIDLAIALKPRFFLMENVPGMKSAKSADVSFLETAAKTLEERGKYKTALWKLNASAFGVPQFRSRMFLVASSTGTLPARPMEDYKDTQRQDFDIDALPPVAFRDAVFDLPPLEADSGAVVDRFRDTIEADDPRLRRFINKFGMRRSGRLIYNHRSRYNNERDLELYSLLQPGEDSVHLLEKHDRQDLMRYRKDVFDDKYSRLRADMPSRTIVSHLAKDGNGFIHPEQVRSITIREAARLQSFHDDYIFCGSRSDQWIQVGNAVPPVMAEAVARTFLPLLQEKK